MPNEELIRRVLGAFYTPAPAYLRVPLPQDLVEWHCYATDGGHSILIVLPGDYQQGADLTGLLCPAPVKSVLRAGWERRGEYVVCNLPYDSERGLAFDPEDEEF